MITQNFSFAKAPQLKYNLVKAFMKGVDAFYKKKFGKKLLFRENAKMHFCFNYGSVDFMSNNLQLFTDSQSTISVNLNNDMSEKQSFILGYNAFAKHSYHCSDIHCAHKIHCQNDLEVLSNILEIDNEIPLCAFHKK